MSFSVPSNLMNGAPRKDKLRSFIISAHDGRRRIVAAANVAALALGITRAIPLASAQALVHVLGICEAEPEADEAAR